MQRSSASVETKRSQRQAWLMASRPRTLPASVAPVIVGTALAIQAGAFEPAAALVALLCRAADPNRFELRQRPGRFPPRHR